MKTTLAGMEWEVCGPVPGSIRVARITVNMNKGKISITQQAYALAGKPDALMLLYSPEHKTIGLRPVESNNPFSVIVSRTSAGDISPQVSAAGITRRMAADGFDGSVCVPVQWHPDGLLWGDLTMATKFHRKSPAQKGAKAA